MNASNTSGHSPVMCRQCGYKLTAPDAPCPWCEQSVSPDHNSQCRQCQSPLLPEDAFCGRCGVSVQPVASTIPSNSVMVPTPGLQPCPSCGKQVSTLAVACPQCGHPFQNPVIPDVPFPPSKPVLQNDAYWQQQEGGSRWFIAALVLALLAALPTNICIFLGSGAVYCAYRLRQTGSDATGVALMILGIGCMFVGFCVGFVNHLGFFHP